MYKRLYYLLRPYVASFVDVFSSYIKFLFPYSKKKAFNLTLSFEKQKNTLVKLFIVKRGRYNRPFLHVSAMGVLGVGIIAAPILADTYPVFSSQASFSGVLGTSDSLEESIEVGEDVFQTEVSQKPRDEIITYSVQPGDTISTIAKKYNISEETVKWANDLSGDAITVGDELKILPVTGISHKVAKGETVYTIAKKYDSNPQQIVDFPFNDFANPETFSLIEGQILIVPDGVKPEERPTYRRPTYIAKAPDTGGTSASGFAWPVRGGVSQFASWYHMALDITSDVGVPVVAGQSGTVVKASTGTWDGGYGNNIMIDGGNGYSSLYAHMASLNVGIGDSVVAGKTVIGWVGMSGRTTGPHLHFEIRSGGALVNPISYLQ